MSNESKAARLSRLADDIGYALGAGEMPENLLREFRFLWGTTPNSEKDGLALNLRDIETLVKDLRREMAIASGASKYQRVPVTTGRVNYGTDG